MKEMEKSLDSQLWHACAGGMVQMPPVNSKVFYFPQGHAEHAQTAVDFGVLVRIPGLILCRVAAIKFLADSESDEVYAKLRLVPVRDTEIGDNGVFGGNRSDPISEKPASFAKTLTQSDANNGGGFSVPRYCAETIFPRLDYSADPPVQTVIAKDVHGEMWKFRHIYRGTPRRHLLTTGWSSFVNQKKLIAGDSIVFLRADNGDLCIGIRRAKRGIGGGPESPQSGGWNPNVSHYGGFSMFLREDENKLMRNGSGVGMNLSPVSSGGVRTNRRLRPESVIEAASLAASGQPFEVVYYPRASTPEFCVKASSVKEAMQIQWYPGMRFKMAFETEDSSRISWFMGTISSVQVADTIRWPNSPWRLLQVTWDEPDLLQNVKRVSPWLVELVSNMPVIHHMSPFSPPRKKLRLPHHADFPFDGQIPLPSFIGNPLGPNTPPAGIQGTRHAQFGISLSDLYHNNKLTPPPFDRFDQQSRLFSNNLNSGKTKSDENVSCLLTMGISSPNVEKSVTIKTPHFLLFGQPILTEEQISSSGSSDAISQVVNGKCSSEEDLAHKEKVLSNGIKHAFSWQAAHTELGIDDNIHHCMVFTESDDVGQVLDLSVLGSYEELYKKLAKMFGLENSERLCQVLYRDVTGALKHIGDEPFSNFVKAAKRLTILTNGSGNNGERKWITGMGNADNGLDSSSKTGPLSIFA